MKENETDEITRCVISILQAVPDNTSPGILVKSLMGAIGIVFAGTAKDIYEDKMYEDLGELVKMFAQREGAAQIFNSIFRTE